MKVFVLGAGTMGLDIAEVFALNGHAVTVRDMNDAIVTAARDRLSSTAAKLLGRGKLTPGEAELIGKIAFTTDMRSASDAEFCIEAIVENAAVKKQAFTELSGICGEGTVFATNTSSISVTEIFAGVRDPSRCMGMHFFNPATRMKLVELIRSIHTSDATFRTVWELSEQLNKTPIEVNEAPGFVVNRILIPMINEAVGIYAEGVASAEHIDSAMMLGCNHPMGPLALGDLIGLDVVLAIMDTLYNETHDSKYRAHVLLRKMVRGGLTGKKSGRGFYDYSN